MPISGNKKYNQLTNVNGKYPHVYEGIIACDIGLKRIGLATFIQGVILPLDPIIRYNRNQAARELNSFLLERNASLVLVGLPSGGQAAHQDMRQRILHFVSLLEFNGGIQYVNEDYTSLEASEDIMHLPRKKRKNARHNGRLDSFSACKIMERYIEENKG